MSDISYWYMSANKPFFTVTQCCCPRGKSLSFRTNLQVLSLSNKSLNPTLILTHMPYWYWTVDWYWCHIANVKSGWWQRHPATKAAPVTHSVLFLHSSSPVWGHSGMVFEDKEGSMLIQAHLEGWTLYRCMCVCRSFKNGKTILDSFCIVTRSRVGTINTSRTLLSYHIQLYQGAN